MKILIKEERRNDLIEKFILNGYPMVKKVFFTTKKIKLASEPNSRGENMIDRTIINIDFIDGKMTHSPSYMLKKIKNQINPIFGLDIESYGSDWGLEGKMVR